MSTYEISNLDIGIIIGYFIVVLFIGFIFSLKSDTGKDFFLAGRSLGWGAIGFSLFASNVSSTTLVGLSGQAYRSGISVSNYEWMATLVLVFITIFFLPFFIRSKISTIPEYLEKRYSPFARKYVSIILIISSIIVDISAGLYAGVLILQIFFPNLVMWQTYFIIIILAGAYTVKGGLKAVVFTDILQSLIILFGGSIVLFAVMAEFDFSWTRAVSSVPENHMSLFQPIDDPTLPWLGTLIGLPILGFYVWCNTQTIGQRFLGARNLNHARWGALMGGFLKLIVFFLMVIPGVFAITLFPGLENSDLIFTEIITKLLPPGVIGIVLAGVIAAIMSSVDSNLNASSTMIVLDFIQPRRPELSPEKIVQYGSVTTLVLMAFAAIWTPVISNFQGLFDYVQIVLSFIVPPIVTVFFMGVFWSRGTAKGAKYTLIFGHLTCLIVIVLYLLVDISWLHFTITAGLLTLFCFCIYIVISLSSSSPEMIYLQDLTWKYRLKEEINEGFSWYLDYRFLSGILIFLTSILVFLFW
ncbi:MAG: sodium/solute symporter [Saprospiraceae bacterium]